MKKNSLNELRKRSESELKEKVDKARSDLIKEKAKIKAGKSSDIKKIRNLKKETSQILTVIREKEILGSENLK